MKRVLLTLVVAACLGSPALAQEHGGPKMDTDARSGDVMSVASRLACDCGCPHEPLDVCSCGTAQRYRLEIASLFAKGLDKDGVLAAMTEKYGTGLLAEPPNTPIGIFAKRIAPPLLALIGIGLVLLVIRKLRNPTRHGPTPAVDAAASGEAPVDDEYLNKVDEELNRY